MDLLPTTFDVDIDDDDGDIDDTNGNCCCNKLDLNSIIFEKKKIDSIDENFLVNTNIKNTREPHVDQNNATNKYISNKQTKKIEKIIIKFSAFFNQKYNNEKRMKM